MTAKPWGECPDCRGRGWYMDDDESDAAHDCPCAAARRAAFEEALAAEPKPLVMYADEEVPSTMRMAARNEGIAAKNAAIRAKMEGE